MLTNYIKQALRNLRRQPMYGVVAAAGLAVGMVSCVFLWIYIADEYGYDRFYDAADRVYRVATDMVRNDEAVVQSAYSFTALGPSMLESSSNVEAMTRVGVSGASTLVQVGEKYFSRERILAVDSSFFGVFSHRFLRGEPQTALNRPYTIVLTHSTAERYFGDDNPIGRTLSLDNKLEYEVTAVVEDPPANTHLRFDGLSSFETYNAQRPGRFDHDWRILYGYTYVLLTQSSRADMVESSLPAMTESHLQSASNDRGDSFKFILQPLTSIHLRSHRDHEIEHGGSISRIVMLAGIAALVMLVAFINFVCLATARATERAREVGVRKMLGASRSQLARQFLTESMLAAVLTAVVVCLLCPLLLPAFNLLSGKAIRLDALYSLFPSGGFISMVCLTGLGGGIYPAMVMSAFLPASALWGGRALGGSRGMVRRTLIVIEFGAAILLMFAASAIYRQLDYMKNAELGFEKEQVVVLGERFAGTPVSRWHEMRVIKQELLRGPSVERVTLASEWPTRAAQGEILVRSDDMPAGQGVQMAWYQVEEDYLETLGMELQLGRNFSSSIASDSTAILLNQEAVRRLGLAENEIVERLIFMEESGDALGTVIGVVKDFHTRSLQETLEPVVFVQDWARPRNILVKVDGRDVAGALGFIDEAWRRLIPDKPLEYEFLDREYAALYHAEERLSLLAGVFTGLALLVACMGLWSLAAFSTARRTREIGVRKVLGASVPDIVSLLAKDFLTPVVVSFFVAAPAAWLFIGRWLEGYAYRADLSGWMILTVGLLALSVAALTVSYQSVRAAQADPVLSIRNTRP